MKTILGSMILPAVLLLLVFWAGLHIHYLYAIKRRKKTPIEVWGHCPKCEAVGRHGFPSPGSGTDQYGNRCFWCGGTGKARIRNW